VYLDTAQDICSYSCSCLKLFQTPVQKKTKNKKQKTKNKKQKTKNKKQKTKNKKQKTKPKIRLLERGKKRITLSIICTNLWWGNV
jgi:hypothetical protein